MKPSTQRSVPTRREIVFILLLLACLLYMSESQRYDQFTDADVDSTDASHHMSASTSSSPLSTLAPAANDLRSASSVLAWNTKGTVPETSIAAHVPGWTIFDRLYIYKAVVYIVCDNQEDIPEAKFIWSKGVFIENGEEALNARMPTEEDIRVINTKEAAALFGTGGAGIISGDTFLINDAPQFVKHYYHWSAELWLGLIRTYASLLSCPFLFFAVRSYSLKRLSKTAKTSLPPPRRVMFNRLDNRMWRDYAHMNEWVLRASLPSVVMEFADDWRDRAEMGKVFVFDRVVVADRSAAMLAYNFARYQRTASVPFALPGPINWWKSIRNNVIGFAGVDSHVGGGTTDTPVITYISRQEWGRRMLIKDDHEKLVEELERLHDEYGYEVNIVSFDNMSRVEQLKLVARTTILLGVHGNGLTSLVWMNPNPRSTVMEFFYPGGKFLSLGHRPKLGFAHDYEYTTRALGMIHYGFWGNEYFTSPDVPVQAYPEGFQGNSIPINGTLVAQLCIDRLTLLEEVDD
ncbi:hypothetical protein FISHEDRAFT_52250 [Fistulina hepatica ATCC 64428]|nr:hypothetical protein FISHEDRAFT_52250 [Fistulina hepatica ATCC 64428]